jgi:hypothetical protein
MTYYVKKNFTSKEDHFNIILSHKNLFLQITPGNKMVLDILARLQLNTSMGPYFYEL